MKTKKKLQAYQIVVVLVGLLAIGGFVAAQGGFWDGVKQYVGDRLLSQIGSPPEFEETIGAMPGNELQGPEFTVGGVGTYSITQNMQQSTTTLCSIKTPDNATTTLAKFRFKITTGTSTAATFALATSTLQYATSTTLNIAVGNIGTNTGTTWIATSTQGSLAAPFTDPVMLYPNTWVLLRTIGAGLGGYKYVGKCEAVFDKF